MIYTKKSYNNVEHNNLSAFIKMSSVKYSKIYCVQYYIMYTSTAGK